MTPESDPTPTRDECLLAAAKIAARAAIRIHRERITREMDTRTAA